MNHRRTLKRAADVLMPRELRNFFSRSQACDFGAGFLQKAAASEPATDRLFERPSESLHAIIREPRAPSV